MKPGQARGYYFEKLVRKLMQKTNYIQVQTGKVLGRGANHKIDSYGIFAFTIPFVYPIRLIVEAKWYQKKKIGLPKIRDFVGVIKDISENYFVPVNIRGKKAEGFLLDRFTDCGAYFSVGPYTRDAQDYAWAQGIYLVTFSNNSLIFPIIKRVNELIEQDIFDDNKKQNISISDIGRISDRHFDNDVELRNAMNNIFAYVGILDGIYPIIIISDGDFHFNPINPDDLNIEEGNIRRGAVKEYRKEDKEGVNFRFHYRNINFEFGLPINTGNNIIKAIQRTYSGEAFAYIDIPIQLKRENESYRRIFKLNLSLPRKENILDEIKNRATEINFLSKEEKYSLNLSC